MLAKLTKHWADDVKESVVQTLNDALPSSHDLHSQVRQALWDIKGPEVFARHELLDALVARLRISNDTELIGSSVDEASDGTDLAPEDIYRVISLRTELDVSSLESHSDLQ